MLRGGKTGREILAEVETARSRLMDEARPGAIDKLKASWKARNGGMVPKRVTKSSHHAASAHVPFRQPPGGGQPLCPKHVGASSALSNRGRHGTLCGNSSAHQTPIPVDQAAAAQVVQHVAPIVAALVSGPST